jgi:predicted nucleic acid-binding Zn finger protein
MNRPIGIHRHHLSLHALEQNAPVALNASRGTVVACLSGELWVTQAGDPRDYIVPRGYRYCCSAPGLIVVNALKGSGNALVYWTAPDGCAHFNRNGVHVDAESYQRLLQRARHLREVALERLARRLAHGLGVWLRRLIRQVKPVLFRPQKPRVKT